MYVVWEGCPGYVMSLGIHPFRFDKNNKDDASRYFTVIFMYYYDTSAKEL